MKTGARLPCKVIVPRNKYCWMTAYHEADVICHGSNLIRGSGIHWVHPGVAATGINDMAGNLILANDTKSVFIILHLVILIVVAQVNE